MSWEVEEAGHVTALRTHGIGGMLASFASTPHRPHVSSNTSENRAYRFGLLCLATTTLGWGLNWPAMRVVLRELPPMVARGGATLVAALFFALLTVALRQSLRIPRPLVPRLLVAAGLNVFAWMGFATIAMQWLTVAQCALLVYTMPIWATLFAWPIAGQRPSARAIAGLVLCAAGLWTLFGPKATAFGADQWIGVGLSLASATLFALGTVAVKPFDDVAPIPLLAWQLGLGSLPMLAFGLAFEDAHLASVDPVGWMLMVYMTAVPMGLCYLAWFAALRRLPPATASIATLVTPVIGVISAALTLGESLGAREGLALLLVLGGVGLALRRV